MRFLIFITITFLSLSIFCQKPTENKLHIKQYTENYYFGPLHKKFNAYLGKNGKVIKHGNYKVYHEDGTLLQDLNYEHGELHGTCKYYWFNGVQTEEINYFHGRRDGMYTKWMRDRTLICKGIYKNGKPWEGEFSHRGRYSVKSKYEETITSFVVNYREGKKFGKERTVIDPMEKYDIIVKTNYKKFLNWDRPSYNFPDYPYCKKMPPVDKLKEIYEWSKKDKTALSQLLAISRLKPDWPKDKQLNQKLQNWWNNTGKNYAEDLKTKGIIDEKAWSNVLGNIKSNAKPYKILLPENWQMRFFFRAGDYGAVDCEYLLLTKKDDKVTLLRIIYDFSNQKNRFAPPESYIMQKWEKLTIQEAETAARTVLYAVDNPWYSKGRKFKGRNWTNYYPSSNWSLKDGKGNHWANINPFSWDGGDNHEDNFLNMAGAEGPAFYNFTELFPDQKKNSKWKTIKKPEPDLINLLKDELKNFKDFKGIPSNKMAPITNILGQFKEYDALRQFKSVLLKNDNMDKDWKEWAVNLIDEALGQKPTYIDGKETKSLEDEELDIIEK